MARMRFRPFRLKALLPYLSIAMIYPVIALITSEKKLLKFIDAVRGHMQPENREE